MSGCDCTLNSMGLVRMCGSVNTSFSSMALDSVAQFLKESNSILIIIILVINVFKKKIHSAVPGEKKQQQQQNDLTALHNVTIQIMERNNDRNQYKDQGRYNIKRRQWKMRGDPEGDSPAELHVVGSVRSRLQQLETVSAVNRGSRSTPPGRNPPFVM